MRVFLHIVCCVVLFSCSDVNNKEMMVETAEEVVGNADLKEEATAPIATETFLYKTITKQKLQELFDLRHLAKEHPENSAIKSQLNTISQSVLFRDFKGTQKVIAIEALAPPETINDSVQKLKVQFAAEDDRGIVVEDTITAIITSRMFILDGIEQVATKVVFED